ncbi:histidine kinase [Kribbella flavida DSM 17836]|uniref:histidine kinase n=1 Tax=Kribbella flavida (strain DSM 17836 / JCM 10339 / NBRC 14399) TaxID=479435 RepID=D2PXV1_KRIFD|nr:sensor histidine kinase [Kribbella flavida]ADB31743.1 histidine kinase [Kribbella flavida DSM 17836]
MVSLRRSGAAPDAEAPAASGTTVSEPGTPPTTGVRAAGWERPGPTPQQRRDDVVLGLGLAMVSVIGTELARGSYPTPVDLGIGGVEPYVLSVLVTLPLCFRRRFPLTVLLVVSVLFVVAGERTLFAFAGNLVTQATQFMAIYAAAAWAKDRRRMKLAVVVVFVAMFCWLFYGFVQALRNDAIKGANDGLLSPYVSYVVLNFGVNVAYFFGAYFWGRTAWGVARQRHELEAQAAELARQQQTNARRAVIDERLRISRELHDVVAHHISSIGIQAGGARRVMESDPAAAKNALSVIENSSRTAVNEMRQLLGMLRAADPDLDDEELGVAAHKAPQAGADRLPALVVEAGGEGLEIGFHQIGRPVKLPETVSVSVYRIAQEALTNVRRHSTARTAHVTLRYLDETAVEVEVIDDGRPKHAPVGSRLGHVGIRERVALLGGESEIGPRPVGGFRVRARIPLTTPVPVEAGGGDSPPTPSADGVPAPAEGAAPRLAPPADGGEPVDGETDRPVQQSEGATQ